MVHTEELGTWLQKCKNAKKEKKRKSTHNTHWYLLGKADITVCFGATGNLMGCPKWERFILWGAWTNFVHFMGICSLDRLIVEHLAVRYEGWLITFWPIGGRVSYTSLFACMCRKCEVNNLYLTFVENCRRALTKKINNIDLLTTHEVHEDMVATLGKGGTLRRLPLPHN